MKHLNNRNGRRHIEVIDPIGDLLALNMRVVDEATPIPRPTTIGKFYVEEAVEKRAEEQPLLFDAKGEADARPWQVTAAELEQAATVAALAIEAQLNVVTGARKRYEFTAETLGGYTRRAPGEKWPYYTRWLLILGGDVAGVAGAAILLGETVELGVLQAVASGTAAITSGLVAQEVKDSRLARKREKSPNKLTKDESRFAHLFRGGDSGEGIVKWMVGGGLLTGLLIAGSIFALRVLTEGSTAGWAFGLLAAAVALASWCNVYHYADEVADLIDARLADFKRELKHLRKLSKETAISCRDAASTEAKSIKAEALNLGRAAQNAIEATGNQLLNEHPGVAGHGWRSGEHADQHESDESGRSLSLDMRGGVSTLTHTLPVEPAIGAGGSNGDRGRRR